MTYRLPRAATIAVAASLPPANLPGLNPKFSRLVDVSDSAAGGHNVWHILDNGPALKKLGVEPVGTILCVHGNPTWSYLWRRLLTAATVAAAAGQPAYRVIAVDQLEMGFSERTGTQRPLARRVRDLGDLTNTLELQGPVTTFGHDWGGVVSLGWAVDHPQLLSRVMLLNTAVHQSADAPLPAPLRLALKRSVLGAATVSSTAFLDTTLALGHPALPTDVKAAFRAPYRTASRRGGIGGFVADIPVDDSHPSFAELNRIATGVAALHVPALMLWGPRDPIFSDRYLDDLVDRLPHADVHRFEGAGHLVAEDVAYADAALTWLGDQREFDVAVSGIMDLPGSRAGDDRADAAAEAAVDAAAALDRAPHTSRKPLWHNLEVMRDSEDTALIEMVPSVGSGPRVVSWKLLSRRVRQIAAGLSRAGVKKGDRVSLLIQPGADLTAVLYACVRIGAVVVVADAGLGLKGLTRAVRGAWPDHVIGANAGLMAARALGWPGQKISTVSLAPAAQRALGVSHTLAEIIALGADEALPPAPQPDAPAAVLFTSGSTGPAKGVVYTHDQLSAVAEALSTQYGIGFGTGLVAGFAPFALLGPALGARSVTPDMVVTSPKTLTAKAVAAAVAAVDATVVFLSPAAVANVVATASELGVGDRAALRGVTDFLSAGAPVSEPLLAAVSALMPEAIAHTPYGMTEGLLMTDISLQGIREAAAANLASGGAGGVCVGVPAASVRVRISALDANAEPVGAPTSETGITGEIVVSAPHIKDHYDQLWLTDRLSKSGATAGERWHRTGDVG
ncbi:MAG: hydrolase, partial [Glaciihabitans sp.]|nr:hydrolase [Glaciihabitans sp.]